MQQVLTLWRIEAPHFTAGLEVDHKGTVRRAAPIIRYMAGKHINDMIGYCKSKRWKIARVDG